MVTGTSVIFSAANIYHLAISNRVVQVQIAAILAKGSISTLETNRQRRSRGKALRYALGNSIIAVADDDLGVLGEVVFANINGPVEDLKGRDLVPALITGLPLEGADIHLLGDNVRIGLVGFGLIGLRLIGFSLIRDGHVDGDSIEQNLNAGGILIQNTDGIGTVQTGQRDHNGHSHSMIRACGSMLHHILGIRPGIVIHALTVIDLVTKLTQTAGTGDPAPVTESIKGCIFQINGEIPTGRLTGSECTGHLGIACIFVQLVKGLVLDDS